MTIHDLLWTPFISLPPLDPFSHPSLPLLDEVKESLARSFHGNRASYHLMTRRDRMLRRLSRRGIGSRSDRSISWSGVTPASAFPSFFCYMVAAPLERTHDLCTSQATDIRRRHRGSWLDV